MAWRRLGVTLGNQGRDTARRNMAYTRAWELRDRLSARERYHTEATYTAWVQHDTAAAIGAYQAVLEKFPDDYAALNNLALWFNAQGREAEGLAIYKRAINLGAAPYATFGNVIPLEYRLGSPDTALALIDKFAAAFPEHPQPRIQRANLLAALEQYDSAQAILEQLRERLRGNVRWEPAAINSLQNLHRTRGRLQEALRLGEESQRLFLQRTPSFAPGVDRQQILAAWRLGAEAEYAAAFAGDSEGARQLYERAIRMMPQERLPPNDRGWLGDAMMFARLGALDRAREMIRGWERDVNDSVRRDPPLNRLRVEAVIAVAEGRYDEGIGIFRRLRDRQPSCRQCELDDLGEAYDRSNRPDSAIAHFERLLAVRNLGPGPYWKPVVLRRLGQLYEANGDRERALEYYGRFVDLWKDADPLLQPKVAETRRWIAQLAGEPR
jgi:tetratricopeptide (TPR) repeat protein